MTTIVKPPNVDSREEQVYLGIRTQTPMKGMQQVAQKLIKELAAWLEQQEIQPVGPPFLRYHVIDMAGEMDIEAGFPVGPDLPDSGSLPPGSVSLGLLPAGRYANLIYTGNGFTGNKTLIEWARANGLAWDRWDDKKGDAFRSRYETYLTDRKTEHRKTKWEIEVAIKLADDP